MPWSKYRLDHRDVLPLDVLPDVQLRPVQQRVNPHVRAGGEVGLELVPQLRRLVRHVPVAVPVARREVPFLAAAAFLIGPGADDHAGERLAAGGLDVLPGLVVQHPARPLARERVFQRLALERRAALEPRALAVGERLPGRQGLVVAAEDHVQLPLPGQAVAVLDHLRDLVLRVDVHQRQRHVPEEGLAGQPQQHRAVLADRPEHHELLELAIRLAQDVDALGFEFVEMIHYAFLRPTILPSLTCRPHSLCSGFSHHQRPARMSSPGFTARVQGAQPMLRISLVVQGVVGDLVLPDILPDLRLGPIDERIDLVEAERLVPFDLLDGLACHRLLPPQAADPRF